MQRTTYLWSAPGSGDVAGGPDPGGDADPVPYAELGLDVGDVRLDRPRRDGELGGDLRVRVPVPDGSRDVAFATRQRDRTVGCPPEYGELAQQPHCHLWTDQHVTGHGSPDRLDEQGRAGALEQEAVRPVVERRGDVLVQIEGGHHDHAGTAGDACEPPGQLQAVDAGHADVRQYHVGSQDEGQIQRRSEEHTSELQSQSNLV